MPIYFVLGRRDRKASRKYIIALLLIVILLSGSIPVRIANAHNILVPADGSLRGLGYADFKGLVTNIILVCLACLFLSFTRSDEQQGCTASFQHLSGITAEYPAPHP